MQVRPDCEGNSTTLAVTLLTFAWHHDADRAIAHSRDGSPGTGAGGRTRTGTGFRPTDFLTSYGFRRSRRGRGICGLDYPFTLAPATRGRRFRCRPSSLYTFPRQGLGSGFPRSGFPEFERFCTGSFPPGTRALPSPLRLPVPPRPQCDRLSTRYDGLSRRASAPSRPISRYILTIQNRLISYIARYNAKEPSRASQTLRTP